MWTSLAIIVVLLSIVWYAINKAKTQGKLEEKLKVDDLILDEIDTSQKIDIRINKLSPLGKRLLLKKYAQLLSDNETDSNNN